MLRFYWHTLYHKYKFSQFVMMTLTRISSSLPGIWSNLWTGQRGNYDFRLVSRKNIENENEKYKKYKKPALCIQLVWQIKNSDLWFDTLQKENNKMKRSMQHVPQMPNSLLSLVTVLDCIIKADYQSLWWWLLPGYQVHFQEFGLILWTGLKGNYNFNKVSRLNKYQTEILQIHMCQNQHPDGNRL